MGKEVLIRFPDRVMGTRNNIQESLLFRKDGNRNNKKDNYSNKVIMVKCKYFYFLFLCGLMLFSCNNSTIKEKIDGGNFKFWFSVRKDGTIAYCYFGNDGRYDVFIKNESNGFHRYGSVLYEDDLPPEKWILKNDSIGWGNQFYRIVNLDNNRMVIEYKYQLDTMYSCYEGMIPIDYYHKW